MTIWKKAVSTGLTATLLATLLATAAATSVFAAASAGTVGTTAVAAGASNVAVADVEITISAAADAGNATDTFKFAATTGYTITAVTASATFSGTGCTSPTAAVVSGVVTLTTGAACTSGGTFVVSGLKVSAANTATAGTIRATGGTAAAAPAFTGTVLGNLVSNGNNITWAVNPSAGTPADGISTVALTALNTFNTGTNVLTIHTSAGKFIYTNISGATISADGATVTVPSSTSIGVSSFLTLQSPTSTGTATITNTYSPLSGGVATTETGATVTFFAASALNVSEAKSSVKFVAYNAADCTATALPTNLADKADANAADLCVIVKDGNGTAINGAVVAVTITPVGLVNATDSAAGNAQAASETTATTDGVDGVARFSVSGSNVAGTATVSISVTYNSLTTAFAPKAFTFSGPVASIAATNNQYSLDKTAGLAADVVRFTAKDAAGNPVATSGSTVTVSDSTIFSAAVASEYLGGTTPGKIDVTCTGTAGSGTVTVKNGTISSNAITVYCAGPADSFTVAFDKATVAPGGTATLTVTVKDADGLPAYDASATAAGLVSSGALTAFSAVANGMSTATYLAPFNTGVATALVTVGALGSQSASINISTPVAVTSGTAASALGVTTSGPFTTTTKTPAIGKYVTVKLSFGSGAAGQTVEIWTASKSSSGVWSAFTKLTSRYANSNGDVYFYWKSSSAAWLSIRGKLTTAYTNAVQVRWM